LLINIEKSFSDLPPTFEHRIKAKKKEELFQRRLNLPMLLSSEKIGQEIKRLANSLLLLFSKGFWAKEVRALRDLGGFFLVYSLLLYGIILLLILRFKRFCQKRYDHPDIGLYPVRSLAFRLIHNSLPLFGTAVFLDIYIRVQLQEPLPPIIRMAVSMVWVFLVTRWYLDLLKLLDQGNHDPGLGRFFPQIHVLILIIRYVAVFHLVFAWLVGATSGFLLFGRMLFEKLRNSLRLKENRLSPPITKTSSLTASLSITKAKSPTAPNLSL